VFVDVLIVNAKASHHGDENATERTLDFCNLLLFDVVGVQRPLAY
jgi:hypothetical protein